MAKIKTLNLDGTFGAEVEISENLFVSNPHNQAIFDAVIAENASTRQGTHSTLTKAEVRGGGKKPWMQKHTGRARQGSTRNPHWVKGGVAFGPKPTRNYIIKLPKKVSKLAFKSAFTTKATNMFALGSLDSLVKPSTKQMKNFLVASKLIDSKTLVIIDRIHDNFILSTANLPMILVKHWDQVSTKDLLHCNSIIVEASAIKALEMKIG